MSLILDGSLGTTFNDGSNQSAAASPFGLKNRLINSDFRIDQRNAGSSVTPTDGAYGLDRWRFGLTQASKITAQQNAGSVTPPTGFSNYLGITSSSAYSIVSGDIFMISQRIEGFNTADLAWGTANAKTVTLSFWVYSSLTGTFGGSFINSAASRSYPFTYTISSANTWTQISVTIAGDTTGTWIGATNGIGIQVNFGIGVGTTYSGTSGAWAATGYYSATGSTSVVGTNAATLYITGVQLEVGSTATPFERRMYGTELALCQRYCPVFNLSSGSTADTYRGFAANTTLSDYDLQLPVSPRTPPTGITASGTFGVGNGAAGANATSIAFLSGGYTTLNVRVTTTAGSPTLSQGVGTALYGSSNGLIIATGCEL
ncbi:hypothetical protein EB001_06545 [bacterium]|nr:hypothetical protein [bacterium]